MSPCCRAVLPDVRSAGRREGRLATCRCCLTLAAMCVAEGMTLLDVTIVNTALPSIQRELHMTAGQLEWVISVYALSLAAFIPLGGALGDRYGRKRFFLIGMVVFTAGSVACALSTSDVALIASRALQGAGGALMSALTLAILTGLPGRPSGGRVRYMGRDLGSRLRSGTGGRRSPPVGLQLVLGFLGHAPFAIAGFVIAFVAVTESRNPEGRASTWSGWSPSRWDSSASPSVSSSRPATRGRPSKWLDRWPSARPGGVLRPVGGPDLVAHAAAQPAAGP